MYALDAISVAAMFDVEVGIEFVCQQSATPICIRMRGDNILETAPGPECMIGIRWRSLSAIAAYSMCTQMVSSAIGVSHIPGRVVRPRMYPCWHWQRPSPWVRHFSALCLMRPCERTRRFEY